MTPRIRIRSLLAALLAPTLATGLAACGGGGQQATGGTVTLRYGLWDSNQQPVYQKCADAFEKANANIRIKIELNNWNDYWGGLARGFIGETAPDVFTDHLSKYPRFAESAVIQPLNRYARRDGVGTSQYLPGLAELWQTPSGARYGFPKDWDTVAVVSNQAMLQKAGISKAQLDGAAWNPQDGGSFQQLVAHLTVDKKGVRGDQPGFDPSNVAVYGLGLDPGGLDYGQTSWAGFARSLGFELLDRNPWGNRYHYDDPRFIQTIAWWRRMIEKGYMPPLSQARTLGQTAMARAARSPWPSTVHRHLHADQGREGRLLAPAAGARGQLEHVQRPGGLDLGGHPPQGGGVEVGEVPREPCLPEHRRDGGHRLPGHPQRRRPRGQDP